MLRRCASIVRGAEHELLGDLAVGAAGGDELGDLALARGQRRQSPVAARGAHDAVAEPAQLAHGLVAPAQRAEAVERGLGRVSASTAAARSPGGGERAALGEPRARREQRRAVGGVARGRGGRRPRAARAAARAGPRARDAGDRGRARSAGAPRRPRRRRPRAAPRRRRARAAPRRGRPPRPGRSAGRTRRAPGRRRRPASRRPPRPGCRPRSARRRGTSRAARRRGSPAATPSSRRLAGVAQRRRRRRRPPAAPRRARCAPTAASAGCRRARARSTPSSAGGGRLGEAAELDQRRHRLDGEHQQDALAPGLRGDRGAALEVGERRVELPERAARPAVHPERRQPRRELLGA